MRIEEAGQIALSALKATEESLMNIRLCEADLEATGGFWYITFSYQHLTWDYSYKIPFFPPIRKLKKQTQEFKIFSVNTKTRKVEAISMFSQPESEFILIEEN